MVIPTLQKKKMEAIVSIILSKVITLILEKSFFAIIRNCIVVPSTGTLFSIDLLSVLLFATCVNDMVYVGAAKATWAH
jgi:hypothetical protein